MILFFMFAAISLSIIGIFYAVYGTKRKYSEGMLLGVHLPQSAADSGEVADFMRRYYRNTKIFYLANAVVGVLSCLLSFWYLSLFIIGWSVWILEFCAGAIALLYRSHRKLYDLKIERGWIGGGGSRIMAVDTKVTAQSGKIGLSPWYHVLFCALILLPCLDGDIRYYLRVSEDGWIFLLTAICVSVGFGILHVVILRMRNKVYSGDSDVNAGINCMQKKVWSWALAGGGLFNVAAYLLVVSGADREGWISTGALTAWCILETVPALFLIGGFVYMRRQKEKLLAQNERPLYIDDDVYWKNGWYSNPGDKRLLVQDWACSWNYTTNMARPAGKISFIVMILLVAGCLGWLFVAMWRLDFTPIRVELEENRIEITSGYSDHEIGFDEIEDVLLIDRIPDDDYRRINGGEDQEKMIGRFKGKQTGKCRMYLYMEYSPVLEIVTEEGPVYVNSKEEGQTEKWMRELEGRISR